MYSYVVRTLAGEATLVLPSDWEVCSVLRVSGDFRAVPGLVSLIEGAPTPFGHTASPSSISPSDLEYVLDYLVSLHEFVLEYTRLTGSPEKLTSSPRGTVS